ncbi:hypothetical protein DSO57_1000827 [Entomophthora muscae]|uniref:Uncharacterized protein n=1 Tax=Entomophthora muscae TaxID=34485 RepID=A0ACC2U7V0_9FUNG|nr:hypothetical protein DSO57_1000827 [Entomophthora muscae]
MGKKYINNIILSSPMSKENKEEDWTEVIPHQESHYITDFYPLEKHLVIEERIKGYTQLRVVETNSKRPSKDKDYIIKFLEPIFTVHVFPGYMAYNSTVFFLQVYLLCHSNKHLQL